MAAEASQIEALKAENAALAAKISALKTQLGITEIFDNQEKERARRLFDLYDKDHSGFIDRDEFAALAYEMGGDAQALSDDKLEATFKAVNVSGSGKVTFDEFWEWLKGSRSRAADSKGSADGALRVRLQSKAWVKTLEGLKERKQDSKAAVPAAAPAAAPAAPAEVKQKLFNFECNIGHLKEEEAKGGIEWTVKTVAPDITAKTRDEVECPEEVTAFAFVDFGVANDADDIKMGELLGMVEVIIDALPLASTGVYHSHKVDVHEFDDGTKTLRVTFFSALNPLDIAQQIMMQGANPDMAAQQRVLERLIKFSFKFLFPFSLDEFHADKDKPLDASMLKVLVRMTAEVDREVLSMAEDVLARLGPMGNKLRQQVSYLQFWKGLDLTANFGKVDEFLEQVPAGTPGLPATFRALLDGASQQGVGRMLEDAFRAVAGFAQTQRELYTTCRETLRGLSAIHLQLNNFVFRIDLKGLDFVPFLSDLPA